ncbi:MAG: hypothetical protein A3H98_13135 [Bacteroidetes bacterium RIFCSPLOWO2_02_FULL_36_8]|nr:MAG: hypothetical protein A3H98_13135 [Bacteroidetes bacterium RIFCSPLOWO2_02_FULL_36_8]
MRPITNINRFKTIIVLIATITVFSNSAKSQEPQTETLILADVTQGCAPLKVTFSNILNNATQLKWYFGDGATSDIPSPVHIYFQPGIYSVSLTYIGQDGIKDSVIKLAMVIVNEKPIADFTLEINGHCSNDNQIILHNHSLNAVNYLWDMGDGNTLNAKEPVYNYSKSGIFDITLVVFDNLGCNSFKKISSAVEIHPIPDAGFSVSPLSACDISQPFNFSPLVENENSYLWNFGDGTTSTELKPEKYFTASGTYLTTLTVTNAFNCSTINQIPKPIEIATPLSLEIYADVITGCEPLGVNFSSNTNNTNNQVWSFGGTDTISGDKINHTFNNAGDYTVSLTVTDSNGCRFTEIVNDYIKVTSSPIAGFESNMIQTCLPVQVQFTNTSMGGTKYHWDFGDGSFSSETSPVHTYPNAGSYSVSLLVENENGCADVFTQNNPVVVLSGNVDYQIPPVTSGCVPMQINLSYTKADVSGWLWNFGDGTTSQSANPSHTYPIAGNYTVSLTMTLNGGCSITIPEFSTYLVSGIKSDFTVNIKSECPPYSAEFVSLSENVVSWFWDFGDSTYSNVKNPSHTYTKSGYYTISLEVTSSDGCKHSLEKVNALYFESFNGDFKVEIAEGSYPKRVMFTVASSENLLYEWNFGDSTFSNEKNPVHYYSQPGVFIVTLKITNSKGCEMVISKKLGEAEMGLGGVFGNLTAEFSTDEGSVVLGCAPREVHFINESEGAISWNWNFGDGASSSEKNPQHTYLYPGNYTVSLIAKNPSGSSDTIVYVEFVKITGPVADYNFSYPTLCEINKVAFMIHADTSLSNGSLQYFWDFGDGTNSNEENPVHNFPSSADYQTKLTVTDQNGCLSNKTQVIHTGENYNISATQKSGCKPLVVTFNIPNGVFSEYKWNFGDGKSDTISNPSHLFENTGNNFVSVELTDSNNCKRTIYFKDTIHVFGPTSAFSIQTKSSGCDSLRVVFQNNSTGAENYLWNFGDGFQSSENSPSHIYVKEGKMSVTLIAYGQGCSDTSHLVDAVQIGKPVSSFLADGDKGCLPFPVSFQNTSANCEKYLWNFGDGFFSEEKSPVHIFSAKDTFFVSLIAWSFNGCADTFYLNNPVIVTQPEANFSSQENYNCPPALFNFTDHSNGSEKWEWNFGDGSLSGVKNPSHIYTKSGYYDIQLLISDSSGCTDTLTKPGFIHVQGPVVAFESSLHTSCGPARVDFVNQTTNANSYFWSFGDGNSAKTLNPTSYYTGIGNYLVTLIANDTIIGCSDFYSDTLKIFEVPNADFTNQQVCKKEVQFSYNITNPDSAWEYHWDFGDGATSEEISIFHRYQEYGSYTISLTVETPNGCSDTKTNTIHIEPVKMVEISVENVCEGKKLQFFENVNPDYKNLLVKRYWDFGDGSSSEIINPEHSYMSNGIYPVSLIIESENGCVDTVLKNVTIYSTPDPVILTENFCEDVEVKIKGDAGKDNDEIVKWLWSFQQGNAKSGQSITQIFENAGEYKIKLYTETMHKCVAERETTILIHPTPVADFSTIKQEICGSEEINFENMSQLVDSDTKYFWSFGDGDTSVEKSPVHSYKEQGYYTVTLNVINASGCTNLFVVEKGLNVNPMPEASFILQGEPTSRDPQVELINTGFSYSTSGWDLGDGSYSEETNPLHLYADTGNFLITLRVTGSGGCSDTVSEWVHVKPYSTLYIPNAFTPDQDGLNDVFKPEGNGLIVNYSFKVFDRWGKEMFESNHFDLGWDGNFNGTPVPLGVYTWIISGRTIQQKELLSSGTVTVLR